MKKSSTFNMSFTWHENQTKDFTMSEQPGYNQYKRNTVKIHIPWTGRFIVDSPRSLSLYRQIHFFLPQLPADR
jgi:hypothetical protein